MRAQERASARKQLDKRLNILKNVDILARPSHGWIKAIRESFGMTTTQLGKRLSISQPGVISIEKAEASKSITLESLERVAQALDCRLVYALVPRKPLQRLVEDRANELAKKHLRATSHSMALEDQRVDEANEQAHLKKLVQTLLDQSGSALWEGE
jgi:predicted DNA-binding mobile mystery protein A